MYYIQNFDKKDFKELLKRFNLSTKSQLNLNYNFLGIIDENFFFYYIYNIISLR